MMKECESILYALQAEDFALYDTVLYLDGHPTDAAALEAYREHRRRAAALTEKLEEAGFPLTIGANNDPNEFRWVTTPWPWEKGVR